MPRCFVPRCVITPAGPDLPLRDVVSGPDLDATVRRIAGEIGAAYPDGVLLIASLKGSILFLADLVRAMPIAVPVEVDFLAVSSYAPESGRVRILKDLDVDIHDRDVVLVKEIVDTGLSLAYMLGELERRGPRSLEVCTLFDRAVRRVLPTNLRFTGFEVGDEYLLGYGLDHDEQFRNLRRVVAADVAILRTDPAAYVTELYGTDSGILDP